MARLEGSPAFFSMPTLHDFLASIRTGDTSAVGILADWLEETEHPLAARVRARYRRWDKARRRLRAYPEAMEEDASQRWRQFVAEIHELGGRAEVEVRYGRTRIRFTCDMNEEERHLEDLLRRYVLRLLG